MYRLSNIDTENRKANCLNCGIVKIKKQRKSYRGRFVKHIELKSISLPKMLCAKFVVAILESRTIIHTQQADLESGFV